MSNSTPEWKVPLSNPDLTDQERQAVLDVLHTPNLSMGPEYQAFEKAIANYVGAKHAIAVSSGTSGLHLCVRAADIQPGDLVLTTPFSFMASTNVILYEKAIPVFVDAEPLTGNIDPVKLTQAADDLAAGGAAARKWLPRKGAENHGPLKAILPVDVFGQPAEMEVVSKIADKYNLVIIEDSCEALGSTYYERPAGMLGDMGVFAFYPNKQITTAEGGLIVTDNDAYADMMRAMRNQGRAPGDTWLQHSYLGYNYRIDELSAALGRVQMSRVDELLAKRAQVAAWYTERLIDQPLIEIPQVVPSTTKMGWFVYVIRVAEGIDRDAVIHQLAEKGIPARPYFAPIHLQLYMIDMFGYQPGDYPVTEDLGNRGIAIPFSSVMTEDQVETVCQVLAEVLEA